MRLKKSLLPFFFVGISMPIYAQFATDALRYSYVPQYGGTARAIGAGGTLGSLGADFSTISTNPAGLGSYRKSEFVISPGFVSARGSSLLLNSNASEIEQRTSRFTLGNVGVVGAHQRPFNDSRWRTFNWAIGFNNLMNFNNSIYYKGASKGSIVQRFRDDANLNESDPFGSALADSTQAIYRRPNGTYTSDFDLEPNADITRSQVIETSGGISEMVLAFGTNYNERIQIGATVGIPFINYTENKIYRESDPNDDIPYFDELAYNESFTTSGVGVNLKLGLIAKPTQFLRLGVAVHTPTVYRMSDRFNTSLRYDFTDSLAYSNSANSPDGAFDYKLNTPWRAIGSVGLVLGKSGFINADVEYANYGNARFNYDATYLDDELAVNTDIQNRYNEALNVRLGGEYAYEVFRFRAGAILNGSPRSDKDFWNMTYTAGLGLRTEAFFMDLGYQLRGYKENYAPYTVRPSQSALQPQVTNTYRTAQFVLTFGFKF